MAKYMTEQRRKLIAFLQENPDRQLSAREIADHFGEDNISLSAVYRNLSALEEDNLITVVFREGVRDKYYRCLLSDECKCCIHLTCSKCGKSIHLNKSAANTLIAGTQKFDGFKIDTSKSVLYGICKNCG